MDFSINFNHEKNELLRSTRGVCFEDAIEAIAENKILADLSHPNKIRSTQKIYVIQIKNYAYAVPYVINLQKKEIFLKTLYPSRTLTKKYLNRGKYEKKDK